MIVLSLFNGCSGGLMALNDLGIYPEKYYASEIDRHANYATDLLYPDVIHLGDVKQWRSWAAQGVDFSKIDLIMAGSPCQSFSIAGKQLNFKDPRGQLFFDAVDILNHIKSLNPKVKILFENVRMKKEFSDLFSKLLGVESILINSSLVSAQNRNRLYWVGKGDQKIIIDQPEDRGILLKDIVHEYADVEDYAHTDKAIAGMCKKPYKDDRTRWDLGVHHHTKDDKSKCIKANTCKGYPNNVLIQDLSEYIVPFDKTLQILDKEVQKGKVGYFRKDSQANRVYFIHDKAVTLCGAAGGGAAKMSQYLFGCITPDRINKRQNGQRFNEGHKFYTLTAQDKHGVLVEGYIRKLTPVECMRLQTFPKEVIDTLNSSDLSKSAKYKMVGNGWTVEVIKHILFSLLRA